MIQHEKIVQIIVHSKIVGRTHVSRPTNCLNKFLFLLESEYLIWQWVVIFTPKCYGESVLTSTFNGGASDGKINAPRGLKDF